MLNSNQPEFPGAVPVISEVTELLLGYVFPAPVHPGQSADPGGMWTFATAADGVTSSLGLPTRCQAVNALAAKHGITEPDQMRWLDLDLVAVLHGLTHRYARGEIARTAVKFAAASNGSDALAARVRTCDRGEPLNRFEMHRTIAGLLGPFSADELLTAYDTVAGTIAAADTCSCVITSGVNTTVTGTGVSV